MKPEKLRAMQGAHDESVRRTKQHRGDVAVARLVSEIKPYKAAQAEGEKGLDLAAARPDLN